MKTQIERIKELASTTTSVVNKNFSTVQDTANRISATTLAAGKSAQQSIKEIVEHENTKAAVIKAKGLATSSTNEAKKTYS
ncbi:MULTISPECIES: hypothetical protein [Giesbergeria]|uniref:TIGR04197 family type VII secretion effector n=1 Tax=Giesbergeria sinuosa TaxID=80883 RepID=A0ABV9QDV8_9BURK